MLTHQLGWHYRIRLKSNTWIWRGNKGWVQLHNFHLNRGQAICLHNLRLHKGAYYGIVHVVVGRNNLKVKAALINGWKLLHSVVFTSNQDPTPAMASRKQHEQRLYQLEFKVQTYSYAVS
ncbi:MAG TPA: hypothetical protein ACFCUY_12205 [Xenococcaceae cyanobacterium]